MEGSYKEMTEGTYTESTEMVSMGDQRGNLVVVDGSTDEDRLDRTWSIDLSDTETFNYFNKERDDKGKERLRHSRDKVLEEEEVEFKKISVPVRRKRKKAIVKEKDGEEEIVLELGGDIVHFEEDIFQESIPYCEGSALWEDGEGPTVESLLDALKAQGSGLKPGKRTFVGRKYPDSFYARELVTWLLSYLGIKDRDIGVKIGDFLKARGIIAHVLGESGEFKDVKAPYQFVSDKLELPNFTITSVLALMERIELDEEINVADREYRRVIYTDCFIASKLVKWMMANLPITSRKEAVKLGAKLVKAGCILHALKPHKPFEDKQTYFRLVPKPSVAASKEDFTDVIHINKKQFLDFYKHLSPQSPAHQTERLFGCFDKNHDGFLNLDEFVEGMGILRKGGEPLLKVLFDSYDAERKGYIGAENLVELLKDTMMENNLKFNEEQLSELANLLIGRIDAEQTHATIDYPKFRAFFGLRPSEDASTFKWDKNHMLVTFETEAIEPTVQAISQEIPEEERNRKIEKKFIKQFHLEKVDPLSDVDEPSLRDLTLEFNSADETSAGEDGADGDTATTSDRGSLILDPKPTPLFVPPLQVAEEVDEGHQALHHSRDAVRFIARAPVSAFSATDDWYDYNPEDFEEPPEPKKHGLKRVEQLYNRVYDYLYYRRKILFWLFVWAFFTAGFFVWRFLAFYYSEGFELFGWSGCFSRGFAGMIYINLPMMLVTMSRISILTWLRSKLGDYIPFDHYISFHILCAYTTFLAGLGHTGCHLNHFYILSHSELDDINDALYYQFDAVPDYWELCFTTIPGLTGILMVSLMILIIGISSVKQIRTYFHEYFYAIHYICFLPIIILTAIHGTQQLLGFPIFWCFLIIPCTIYFVEKLYRIARIHFWRTTVLDIVKHPSSVMEFRFRKPRGFRAKMGQHVFINCPAVSWLQTHPFTLSSSPAEDFISVHIRKAGDWTSRLHQIGEKYIDNPSKLTMRVDGAFGAPYERIYKYRFVIMVAAGIGVTPFASVLKDLNIAKKKRKRRGKKLQKAYFFWVNRDQQAFEWFAELLNAVGNTKQNWLEINTYLTSAFQKQDLKSYILWDALQKAYKKHKKDFVTGLHSNTFWGRPNWDEIFHQLKKKHSQNRIGVFFCGPPVVAKELSKWCRHYSRKGTTFDFHAELFN